MTDSAWFKLWLSETACASGRREHEFDDCKTCDVWNVCVRCGMAEATLQLWHRIGRAVERLECSQAKDTWAFQALEILKGEEADG